MVSMDISGSDVVLKKKIVACHLFGARSGCGKAVGSVGGAALRAICFCSSFLHMTTA